MYFEQFKPYSAQGPTGFIRTINHQLSHNPVHLVCCEFNANSFSDQCFAAYGIDYPADIKGAVLKRKAEFLAGRIVAKRALSALGLSIAQQQVSIAQDRSPVWPKNVRGSISHTTEFAVCCVGRAAEISLIGVDSELILSAAAAQSVAAEIHNETELKLLTDAGYSAALATSIIFSAKESLYKATYPRVRCFFGFDQASVRRLDLQRSILTLSFCRSFACRYGLAPDHNIQFMIKDPLVLTLLMQ